MNPTAAGLAAYGRNGDTTLVHMTPREVAGLQAFANANGTSLTVNPHTGLPEAFSLDSLLPTIAGAGLMMIPGMQPLAAGLIVGATHGLLTGFKDPFQSAMAGLGGAGGAGLGANMGIGAAQAATPAATAANAFSGAEAAANLGVQGAASGAGSQAALLADQASGFGQAGLDAIRSGASYAPGAFGGVAQAPIAAAANLGVPGASTGIGSQAAMLADQTSGFGQAGMDSIRSGANYAIEPTIQSSAPVVEGSRNAGMLDKIRLAATEPGMMSTKTSLMLAGAPMAAGMFEPPKGPLESESYIRPYEFKREVTPGAFDDLTDSRERRYFDDKFIAGEPYKLVRGGLAAYARGGKAKNTAKLNQLYSPADVGPRSSDSMAMQKRAMSMYEYAAGGKTIRGEGDGMSDHVRANIDGVQEARLSDGEFVIPADVVSGLGNGSTEAGSKQLHAMMDRVRQKRTGKKRQAPQIKARDLMPA